MVIKRSRFKRFWPFGKRKPKPLLREKVFPSSEFPILERGKFEHGWRLLESVGGAMSEEKLKQVLRGWGEKEDVSRDDAIRLLRLWGVQEEIIERVVRTHPHPK